MTRERIETASAYFVKLNAFLAAKKILGMDFSSIDELPEPLLTLAWETLTDLSGYARPTERWTGR